MNKMITKKEYLSNNLKRKPDKTETYAGKQTARVTQIYKNTDGSESKITRKINKDGSITDKLEHRHN